MMSSDKTTTTSDKITDYYLPTIVSYSDYDQFGTIQSERNFQGADPYRFGFQGQERDDEMKQAGNSWNYEYRMHDPRIGRFFAVDPLAAKYPYYSSYQFSGNRLIDCAELEGLEPLEKGKEYGDKAQALKLPTTNEYHNYTWTKGGQGQDDYWKEGDKLHLMSKTMQPLESVKMNSSQNISVPKGSVLTYSPTGFLTQFSYNDLDGQTRVFNAGSKGGYFWDNGNILIKYLEPRFFSNEAEGFRYMVKNTESGPDQEDVYTEQIAFITNKGIWVGGNAYNTGGSSIINMFYTVKDNFVYIQGERVLAMVHTHPSFGDPDFWTHDINVGIQRGHKMVDFSISMQKNGLVDGIIVRGVGAFNYWNVYKGSFSSNMTTQNLANGKVKLIPILSKIKF